MESKEDAQLSRESACPVEELPGEESQDVGIHLGGDVLASKDPVEEGHVSVEQDIVPVELGESLEGFLEAERQGEHGGNVEQKEQSHEWSGRLREGTRVDYAQHTLDQRKKRCLLCTLRPEVPSCSVESIGWNGFMEVRFQFVDNILTTKFFQFGGLTLAPLLS